MRLSVEEKIRLIAKRRGITLTELAKRLGISKQSLSRKLKGSNFTETEILIVCMVLDCSFDTVFTMNDTGEQI